MTSSKVDGRLSDDALSPEARALLESRARLGERPPAIPVHGVAGSHPLSLDQEMVWLSCQIDNTSPVFNRCTALRITGALDEHVLQLALTEIVRRHAILRSRIVMKDGAPVTEISPDASIPLHVVDLEQAPAVDMSAHVAHLLDAEVRTPFDLDRGPLIRAGLFRESGKLHTLYISTHHIVSDGWSDGVMLRELDSLYAAFSAGKPSPLGELKTQFTDFAAWQRERATSPAVQRNVRYWQQRMAGAPNSQHLPVDRPRPEVPDVSAGQVKVEVPAETARRLTSIGRRQNATPAATLLAAFHLLQFRITGQADSVVGLSLAARTRPELHELIGLFNSVLPVRVEIDRNASFGVLLDSVRVAAMEAQAYQDVPVDAVLEALPSSHGVRHPEIAQTLFNFRNMPSFEPSLAGLQVESLETFNGGSVADLELEVIEKNSGWECVLRFRRNLFDQQTAERILGHYLTLLRSIASDPEVPAGRVRILTDEERQQLLVGFSGPIRDFNAPTYLDVLFSEQAKRSPSAVAVSSAVGSLTYAELDRSSDALGRQLQSLGVGPGDFVGVCMERSLETVVSLLAILKCGAAFVPLDTEHPPERLGHMLGDTNPRLLIADERGESLLGSRGVPVLRTAREWLERTAPDDSPFFVARPLDAVACVLYTSGSTGLPKGVLSTHRGIANNIQSMQATYGLTADDCMLQQTSLGFDAAAWEIFWPLAVGARTWLARHGGQREADYVLEVITEQKIATVGFAPSMLKVMLGMPGFTGNPNIRRIMSYGEVLSPKLVSDLFARMPEVEIHNLYGPTETSITITEWNCERRTSRRSIPIGRAIANVEVYLLDAGLEPVPIGVEGELYIGGVCVANGYHNRPELTAQRFVSHPFRSGNGDKVYRSGDIARFDADGVIEYVGRRDHQFKIRGVRVELEEIESALLQLPGIRESVVVAVRDADDEPRLVAYVAVDESADSPKEMVRMLERQLPPQFIPAQIVCLDSLPHSLNGKIDRKRLPAPPAIDSSDSNELPRTETEKRLAGIWSELLSGRVSGVDESFFYVGGHSLLAVRMLQRISDEMGAKVSLRAFYQEPTIRAVAKLVSGESADTAFGEHAPILKIRDGATGSEPLFYLNGQPPGGGKYANEFARFLPEDQGLSIVPVPIFENPVTVEGVAARMVQLIRSEQPRGPYLLGGNCFGATVVFEIAQQLTKAGEEVSLLTLVHPDARTPMHLGFRAMRRVALLAGLSEEVHFTEFSGAFDFTMMTIRRAVDAQLRSSSNERRQRLNQMGTWLKEFVIRNARRPGIMLKTLRDRGPREADERIQDEMKPGLHPTPVFNSAGDQTAQMEMAAHAKYMSDAWTAYDPKPYHGRVAIIWPVEGPANPPWDPRALWNRLTPDLDWRWVSGNHWTMLHEHFDESARALAAALAAHRKK